MNKHKKLIFIVLPTITIITTIAIFLIFYYLGIGFGNAVANTVKGVRAAKNEWVQEGVNPIDSIKLQVQDLILDDRENKEN